MNVMKVLRNCDVIEHIASFLNSQDLGSWYNSCKTVRDCIDSLSLWRKHAKKLVKIMGMRKNILKEKGRKKSFNCKSQESAHFQKLCSSIQKNEVKRLRKKMNKQRRLVPAEITNAARLAHHGLLGSVGHLPLRSETWPWENLDLASIPTEQLASLVSCVTERIDIQSVIINCDIISILDNVKSNYLNINRQSLSSEETQALVRAMESGVKCVALSREARLDISALTQYSGQGKCKRVYCFNITTDGHREEVKNWALRINWGEHEDNDFNRYLLEIFCPKTFLPR